MGSAFIHAGFLSAVSNFILDRVFSLAHTDLPTCCYLTPSARSSTSPYNQTVCDHVNLTAAFLRCEAANVSDLPISRKGKQVRLFRSGKVALFVNEESPSGLVWFSKRMMSPCVFCNAARMCNAHTYRHVQFSNHIYFPVFIVVKLTRQIQGSSNVAVLFFFFFFFFEREREG